VTGRLRVAAGMVPAGSRLCDVGTDHARLPLDLLRRGVIPRCVLTDLRAGPLNRARMAVTRAGFQDRVDFRLTDGLHGIGPDDVDCVTITGLGGVTIRGILAAAPWTKDKTLILQPMQGLDGLRAYLCAAGYTVTAETLAQEGLAAGGRRRVYHIMAVTGGAMALSPGEMIAGCERYLRGHPLWPGVIDRQIKRFEDELRALRGSVKRGDHDRMNRTAWILTDLQRLKENAK